MNNINSTIVHISDPHFGTESKTIADQVVNKINEINPEVVVVSGDITQRALSSQFKKAQSFLEEIKTPKLVIPGNHDIPLYNVFERFADPFAKYNEFISSEEYPKYTSNNLSLVGVNTCTPFKSQSGRIKEEDIDYLKNYFSQVDSNIIKSVVVHHNIMPYEGLKGSSVLGNAETFLPEMNKCGVDLIFAGHLHKSLVINYSEPEVNNSMLLLQAGTCISARLREEENTFLMIETTSSKITVNTFVFNRVRFELADTKTYNRMES